MYLITETGLYQTIDQLGWGEKKGDPPPPGPLPPDVALVRMPDGDAVYTGDQGTNWRECGGGRTLFYGLSTPGTSNLRSRPSTDLPEQHGPVVPRVTRLLPPAPNPFNPAVVLRYELAKTGSVELAIYDVRGRQVMELVGGVRQDPGPYQVEWQGVDHRGQKLTSGLYYARLRVDGEIVPETRRLVLLK